jgi:hypothetical protein
MLHFSKVLHVENRGFLYFSFKCTNSPENKKCGVQVWTEGEQCHDFVMEERNGAWKMVQTALPPQWIVQLEAQLQAVICKFQLQGPAFPSKFRIQNHGKTGS